jgi:pyruvate-ferredoxin/flavodoxin oxidoreductase
VAQLGRRVRDLQARTGVPTSSTVSARAPAFVREVIAPMMEGRGDLLPVSAFPVDGTFPTGTAKWEKRNIATEIPIWDPACCTQCMKCVLVCPHASIRGKMVDDDVLNGAPEGFRAVDAKAREFQGKKFILQVSPEDCTGCGICVDICPARNKSETRLRAINMREQAPLRKQEKEYWDYFENLPILDRTTTAPTGTSSLANAFAASRNASRIK